MGIRPGSRIRTSQRNQTGNLVSSWFNFTPLTFSNLTLWLDASDTSTIIESSNLVSQWNDKSGNGINLSQATSASQPSTNTGTQNGLNVLTFDGLRFLTSSSFTVPATAFSVYAALRLNSSTTRFIFEQSSDNSGRRYFWRNGTELVYGYRDSSNFRDYKKTWTQANEWVVVSGSFDGGNIATNVSKTLETISSRTGVPVSASRVLYFGAAADLNFKFIGDIGEFLLYDTEHNFSQRQRIIKYLANKWNTVI